MPPVRRLFLALCLLAMAGPQAGAGTADMPDIVDPPRDIHVVPGPLVNVPAPEIDILGVWVEATPTIVRTTFQFMDVSHRIHEEEGIIFALRAKPTTYDHVSIQGWYGWGEWLFFFSAERHDGSTFAVVTNGEVDTLTNRIHIDVPRTLLNSTLYDAKAGGILIVPIAAGINEGGGTVWFRDWAPNDLQGVTIPIE